MNSFKDKVKYICEYNRELGVKKYYKIQFLNELNMWGCKRQITENTFVKRSKEGFESEYKQIKLTKETFEMLLVRINTFIDMSLDTWDEDWFMELSRQKRILSDYFS